MIPASAASRSVCKVLSALGQVSSMRGIGFGNRYLFSSSSAPKQQFLKTFLVKIHYNNPTDAYYETYPHREQFRKQVKKLQETNKCYILGGDLFPFESTQLVANCDQKSVIQNFLNNNVYQQKKLIKQFKIEEVEKISQQKMKKLTYFYQYA